MRERLAEYYDPSGKAIQCFTAQFECFGKTDEGSNVALLVSIRLNGKFVCDHAWIHKSKSMKALELRRGDVIQFEAVVGRYTKGIIPDPESQLIEWDYCLNKIREMTVVLRRNEGNADEHD